MGFDKHAKKKPTHGCIVKGIKKAKRVLKCGNKKGNNN